MNNPILRTINFFDCKNVLTKYKCEYCDFTTDLWISLNYHVWRRHESFHDYNKIDSNIETYTCENCKFTSYSILVWHRHGKKCTNVSKSPQTMSYFIDREKLFCCKICEFKSLDDHDFQLHLLQHHTEDRKSIKCDQCEYKTNVYRNYRAHKLRHIRKSQCPNRGRMERGWKVYTCNQCSYETFHKSNLTSHIIVHHTASDEIKWFKCDHCSYKGRQQILLKRHIDRRHTPENQTGVVEIQSFECDQCEYKTSMEVLLKCHISRVHAFENPEPTFVHRNATFKNRKATSKNRKDTPENRKATFKTQILITHAAANETKLFHCNECEYTAKQKVLLQRHISRKHPSEDPVQYECTQCSYKCIDKYYMKHHVIARHTNSKFIKWFECDQCEYKAKRKDRLMVHINAIHKNIRWFPCSQCTYKAKRKDRLMVHIRKKHPQSGTQEKITIPGNVCAGTQEAPSLGDFGHLTNNCWGLVMACNDQ